MTIDQNCLQFLNTYFGDDLTFVYVCHSGDWKPQPAATAVLDPAKGWYWCPARLTLDANGQRLKENALSVHALVIDDVGQKIDRDAFKRIAGSKTPTTLVETSPGNWQAGYRLEGVTPAEFEALRLRLPWKADGADCVHWWRLPGGVNPKPEHKGFKTGKAWYGTGNLDWLPAGGGSSPGAPGRKTAEAPLWLVEKLLGLMPNDPAIYPYEAWIAIGIAVKAACGEAGRDAWKAWSATVAQGVDLDDKWDTFDPTTSSGIRKLAMEAELRSGPSRVVAASFDDGEVEDADPVVVGLPKPKQLTYAEDIMARWGDRLRWNLDRKAWYEFDRVLWQLLAGRDRAMELSIEMARRAPPKSKGDADTTTANFHSGVEALTRRMAKMHVRQAQFDADPFLLGTPGGTVDLRTGVLGAARAGDLISKSTAVAPAQDENCPQWKRFVREVTQGDPESAVFLQQWFGYCLTGLTVEEVFLFLFGPGGNGKSVMVDTIAAIMGSYFTKPVGDLFVKKAMGMGHTSKLAMLAGARMCSVSEVPAGAQWDEGLLKDVTGGGTMTGGFKHKDEFTFTPQFKLTISGNHQPTFPGGIDPAIKRRFWMIEFGFVPKVVDKHLTEKLVAEWPGILRWMINGCLGWQKTGLLKPGKVDAFTEAFFDDQDLVAQWLAECVEKSKGDVVKAQDLFRAWIEWRNGQGEHHLLDSVNTFGLEMKKRRGLVAKAVKTGTEYQDIRLKKGGAFDDITNRSSH